MIKKFDNKNIEEVLESNSIKYIGFDFFDTIVHRDCHPEIVLYEWAKSCAKYFNFKISPSDLYNLRKDMEKLGKKQYCKEELQYSDLIKMVYDSLSGDKSFETFLEYSLKEEICIELEHQYLDKDILHIFHKIKDAKKKIVIISDFYAGIELFEKIVKRFGIEHFITNIYISSEIGLRKMTGNLYKFVCKDLNINVCQMLMIGDNKKADYEVPKSLGVDVLWKPYTDNNSMPIKYKELEQFCIREAFSNPIISPLSGYVPEILYSISMLHAELVRNDVTTVFFFSREGQFMKKLFDYYLSAIKEKNIRTEYLYISRKAMLLPALTTIDQENFNYIFRQFKKISLKDFLQTLSFSELEISIVTDSIRINKDEIITDKDNDLILGKLKIAAKFVELYNEKRSKQKEYFINYIESFGNITDRQNTINIVDIGWKGTIQDCFQATVGSKYRVRGFYLGILGKEFGIKELDKKKGLLFVDTPRICNNFGLLSRTYMFYERIFVADHGPVIGYKCNDNVVSAVIDERKEELALFEYMKVYQKKMEESFERMLGFYTKTQWLPYELYDLMVELSLRKQCLHFPKIWKVEKTARDKARENFGDISKNDKIRIEKTGIEQLKKKDFYFIDYSYRILEKYHLCAFKPLAALYCRIVYRVKRKCIKKDYSGDSN